MSNLNKRRQLLSALLALTSAPLAYAAIDPVDLIRVYMIPMDDFPEELTSTMARFLQQKLNMRIKASLKIPALNISPLPGTNQYSSEDILERGKIASQRLPEASTETYRIFLTMRDINTRSGNFRFQYASHNPSLNSSVISAARMFDLVEGKLKFTERTGARLAKMILRTIGEMQLGWKRNSDPNDLMYAPIMGMDDLDRIGFEYHPISTAATPQELSQATAKTVGAQTSIQIMEEESAFLISVPVSQLTLRLSKTTFKRSNSFANEGSTANPRYFLFEDTIRDLTLSGWFEHANKYQGVKPPAPAIFQGKALIYENLKFEKIAEWDCAFYNNRMESALIANVNANIVRAGTWIELHLSGNRAQALEEQQALLIEIIRSIEIYERENM